MILLFVIQLFVSFESANAYEDHIYCATDKRHALCGSAIPEARNSHYFYPTTDGERMAILDGFNKMRSDIAGGKYKLKGQTLPQASGMLQLQWSKECEVASWNEIDLSTCFLGSSSPYCCHCQNTGKLKMYKFFAVLNTAVRNRIINPHIDVQKLFDDINKKIEGMSDILKCTSNPSSKDCISSNNYPFCQQFAYVGCAFAFCKSLKKDSVFECHFGGPMKLETVYNVGPACSQCHPNAACSTQYSNLCACKKNDITCYPKPPNLDQFCNDTGSSPSKDQNQKDTINVDNSNSGTGNREDKSLKYPNETNLAQLTNDKNNLMQQTDDKNNQVQQTDDTNNGIQQTDDLNNLVQQTDVQDNVNAADTNQDGAMSNDDISQLSDNLASGEPNTGKQMQSNLFGPNNEDGGMSGDNSDRDLTSGTSSSLHEKYNILLLVTMGFMAGLKYKQVQYI